MEFDTRREMPDSSAVMTAPVVVADRVTRSFGSLVALKRLSLSVRLGETYGLIGPNGSGKTTLIRLVVGLARPNSGEIRVLGRRMPDHGVAQDIGYMTQSGALYLDLTVQENLEFFGSLYGLYGTVCKARIDEVLTTVDLRDRAKSVVRTISGGMRQRLSLACALIHQPRLLVLDEPTVGIDPELRRAFWEHFAELNRQGVTILVTTHHLDEAARCHRLGLLRSGELLAEDTPTALLHQAGTDDMETAFLWFAAQGTVSTGQIL